MRLNPFARRHAVLKTPLTPASCRERLARVVTGVREQMGWLPSTGADPKPLAGSVSMQGFRVCVHRPGMRNSFQTHAYGRFSALPDGTRIDVAIGVHRAIVAFMVAWFGGVLLWGVVVVVGFVVAPPSPTPSLAFLLVAPGFIAVGATIVWVGCRAARDESAVIVETLSQVLDAEEVQDA